MTTEEQILTAARNVFIRKGLDGSRMQEIADEAGINKALLHYYFRSKDKLFERIFIEAFQGIIPKIRESITQSTHTVEFVRFFIENYMQLMTEMPFLPQFVLHEINRDPSRIATLIKDRSLPVPQLQQLIDKDVALGLMLPIRAEHLVINMISMTVFPVVASPFVKMIVFNNQPAQYESFFMERKEVIINFVIRAIGFKNEGIK